MWQILGSWPVVGVVFLVGASALAVAARRTGRGFVAAVVLIAAVMGAGYLLVVPPVVDGTNCVSGATPNALHRADFDRYVAQALRESGLEADPYECRDTLRSRYLMIGVGYLAVTLGAAALLGRRRRLVT